MEYIERESLLVGIGSPESGLDDIINTLIFEHNLDFLHDYDEDEVRVFAKDLISNVRNYIQTEPTADVVEVVRCKDCKHAKLDIYEKGLVVCRRPVLKNGQLLPFNLETTYNDYCSYGELKEREGK